MRSRWTTRSRAFATRGTTRRDARDAMRARATLATSRARRAIRGRADATRDSSARRRRHPWRRRRAHRGRLDGRAGARDARTRADATPETSGIDSDDAARASGTSDATRGLLASFLAMRRGSRFAHQEFCARCARAHRERGVSVTDARLESAMMGLSSAMRFGTSEQDAFASAVAMVTLTLYRFDRIEAEGEEEDEGRARASEEARKRVEEDTEAMGMLKYIDMTNKNADEGYTLRRMELERRFASGGEKRTPTPGESIMRMNCKLTLLTREMIELERGITHARKGLEAMEDVDATVDETEIIEIEAQQQLALAWCTRERTPARELAADMLVAFFSVLTNHPVGYREFVRAARRAYEAGISADEITGALDAPEFDVEGTQRGMFGRAADAPKIFAGLVTTAYVTFEAEGLPLPAAAKGDEDLFAYASHPRASDEDAAFQQPTEDEDTRRARARGLRKAVEGWMAMDRDELANEVSASLSIDESIDDDAAAPFAGSTTTSSTAPGDGSFAVVRDEAFGASSITLVTLRHQRNIVSFVRNDLADQGP